MRNRSLLRTSILIFALTGAVTPKLQSQSQTCIDNALLSCFEGCTDPLNFQQCVIGCSNGGFNDAQSCRSNCYSPVCELRCMMTVRAISNCAFVSGELKATCGAVTFNRATGQWQQVVKIENVTRETKNNIVFILDSLASGWAILNNDGSTVDLTPAGSPYVNVGPLGAETSTTITLQFRRTGTLPFGYITRVTTGVSR